MPEYPLIFTLTHEIRCPNFSARVVSRGRTLMALEDGQWWCLGVEPGGIAEHSDDPTLAFLAFKGALGEVWQDLGEDRSYEQFEQAAQGFIIEADRHETDRWEAARLVLSTGATIEAPFDRLPRETREIRGMVRVERLDHIAAAEEVVVLAEAA